MSFLAGRNFRMRWRTGSRIQSPPERRAASSLKATHTSVSGLEAGHLLGFNLADAY